MTKPLIERELDEELYHYVDKPDIRTILVKCRFECEKRIDEMDFSNIVRMNSNLAAHYTEEKVKELFKQIIKDVYG